MKKNHFLLVATLLLFTVSLTAQEAGTFRLGLEGGVGIPSGGFGVIGAIEGKYNILNNFNAGIRIEEAFLGKAKYNSTTGETDGITFTGSESYLAVADYYFHSEGSSSSFAPFVGLGAGYFGLASVVLEDGGAAENSVNLEG